MNNQIRDRMIQRTHAVIRSPAHLVHRVRGGIKEWLLLRKEILGFRQKAEENNQNLDWGLFQYRLLLIELSVSPRHITSSIWDLYNQCTATYQRLLQSSFQLPITQEKWFQNHDESYLNFPQWWRLDLGFFALVWIALRAYLIAVDPIRAKLPILLNRRAQLLEFHAEWTDLLRDQDELLAQLGKAESGVDFYSRMKHVIKGKQAEKKIEQAKVSLDWAVDFQNNRENMTRGCTVLKMITPLAESYWMDYLKEIATYEASDEPDVDQLVSLIMRYVLLVQKTQQYAEKIENAEEKLKGLLDHHDKLKDKFGENFIPITDLNRIMETMTNRIPKLWATGHWDHLVTGLNLIHEFIQHYQPVITSIVSQGQAARAVKNQYHGLPTIRKTFDEIPDIDLKESKPKGEPAELEELTFTPCPMCGFKLAETASPIESTYPIAIVSCPICSFGVDSKSSFKSAMTSIGNKEKILGSWLRGHGYNPAIVHNRWGFKVEDFFKSRNEQHGGEEEASEDELPIILLGTGLKVLNAYLEAMLSQAGYRVFEYVLGTSIVQQAKTMEPDLILIHENLTDFTGIEVYRLLRASPKTTRTPILFMASEKESVDKSGLMEIDANDLLCQSITYLELFERITRALESETRRTSLGRPAYVKVSRDLMEILQADLIWILGMNDSGLVNLALTGNLTAQEGESFLEKVSLGGISLYDSSPLVEVLMEEQVRLDWPVDQIRCTQEGFALADALEQIGASRVNLIPLKGAKGHHGLLAYVSKDSGEPTGTSNHAVAIATQYASMALGTLNGESELLILEVTENEQINIDKKDLQN